jgi:hypothetical protein
MTWKIVVCGDNDVMFLNSATFIITRTSSKNPGKIIEVTTMKIIIWIC